MCLVPDQPLPILQYYSPAYGSAQQIKGIMEPSNTKAILLKISLTTVLTSSMFQFFAVIHCAHAFSSHGQCGSSNKGTAYCIVRTECYNLHSLTKPVKGLGRDNTLCTQEELGRCTHTASLRMNETTIEQHPSLERNIIAAREFHR